VFLVRLSILFEKLILSFQVPLTLFDKIVGFDEVLQQKPNCPSVPSPLEITLASNVAEVFVILLTSNNVRFTGTIET
jgi:hypothetical protein